MVVTVTVHTVIVYAKVLVWLTSITLCVHEMVCHVYL